MKMFSPEAGRIVSGEQIVIFPPYSYHTKSLVLQIS